MPVNFDQRAARLRHRRPLIDVDLMLETLARLGYASKAIVYAIVGVLAILTALNRGGRITDTHGALRLVLTQPFGRLLLIVLAVGLCGYAAWRLLDAFMDPERHGTSWRGIAFRVGNALRGAVYGALGFEALQLLRGLGGPGRDETEAWTARVLDLPYGEIVVAIGGGIAAVHGVFEVIEGIKGEHDTKIDWSCVAARVRQSLRRISQFGVTVRGGLIATFGVFLVRAAITHDANQAAGARESMLRLGGVFEGRWFLAVIATGVLAYAVDQAVCARCRRIRPVV